MATYRLEGILPECDMRSWVAPTAVVIGRVRLKADASVWWGAVLRGDIEWIEVGEGANVQDNSVFHTDFGLPITIGDRATIGHRSVLHGCTIGAGALVGMGATVLNGAVVGEEAMVGANALVPEGMTIPPRTLALGSPARVIRDLTVEEIARIAEGSRWYVENAQRYTAACDPL
ncbi:gamma carbonic anhydrase family protein [Acuticoccus sp. M5D2P5]|uniref:gamma carbonic anhydrase family protein n=1 Tax=Acuticoccus kalidii TaxID=2910977 RepID=UPI001F2BDD8A|nr:gamma carbonic anhydrase family protein [Acuticoccus kalidii]MCF3935650.1 gamma carbonic anhydrase family protein [Acuticoccus kalidii]